MVNLRLKPISYLVTIFLSLSGADAFAEEATNSKAQKTIAAAGQTHYLPQVSVGGVYGNNESSYGMVDIMVPLAQQADRLLFVDARGLLRKSPVNEVNLGVGYRWLNDDADAMIRF